MNNRRHAVLLAGLALALVPLLAASNVRVGNNRYPNICRVVVTSEYGPRQRVVFDGPAGYGHLVTVEGGNGNMVCISRSINPQDCNLGMTRWRCTRDTTTNRTSQFNVE